MTISTVEGTLSKIENSQEITKEQDSSSHPYQPTDYEEVFKEGSYSCIYSGLPDSK